MKTLFEMKEAYRELEAPPELEERMRDIMKNMETEQKRRPNGLVKALCRVAGVAAAAVLGIGLLANCGEGIAYAMQEIPLVGEIAEFLTFRNYSDSQYGVSADLDIPQIQGLENQAAQENLNAAVNDYAQGFIALHEADVEGMAQFAAQAGQEDVDAHVHLESSYTVLTDNQEVFSLSMDTVLVMAGGTQYEKHFTVDKATGAVLCLKDLFKEGADYVGAITENIKAQMRAQMEADESVSYFLDEAEGLAFTAIDPEQDFYISPEGQIVISFNEYEVAPGYMGAVCFTIPTQALADVLQSQLVHD